MLKVRTSVVNGTFNTDHTTAERWARRPFATRMTPPRLWTVSFLPTEPRARSCAKLGDRYTGPSGELDGRRRLMTAKGGLIWASRFVVAALVAGVCYGIIAENPQSAPKGPPEASSAPQTRTPSAEPSPPATEPATPPAVTVQPSPAATSPASSSPTAVPPAGTVQSSEAATPPAPSAGPPVVKVQPSLTEASLSPDSLAPATPVTPPPATTTAEPSQALANPASAAPSATTAPDPSAASMPAEDGMSEADRRQVQEALRRRSYYRGQVDGVFGPATRVAIRRFQQDIGAQVTGRLTAEEANRLVETH